MAETVRVTGYREFVRACDHAGPDTKKQVRTALRQAGESVQGQWSADEERFGSRTATGLRTIVRTRGISVEQTRRKTTGTRPDFGRLQQRIGDAVFDSKQSEIERDFEHAIDQVADHFNH